MDNDEIEFIAENELITIIPNFRHKTLYLISVSWMGLIDESYMRMCRLMIDDWKCI